MKNSLKAFALVLLAGSLVGCEKGTFNSAPLDSSSSPVSSSTVSSSQSSASSSKGTSSDIVTSWTDAAQFVFKLNSAGTGYIVTGYSGSDESVAIPPSYLNLPVMEIGDYALTSSNLVSVVIPASVTIISYAAFGSTTKLVSVSVVSENPCYQSIDGVLFSKDGKTLLYYPGGSSRTSYVIPSIVTSVGKAAFSSYSVLTSITIPNSVTSIGEGGFAGCSKVASYQIPASVTNIGYGAFGYNLAVTSFSVASENPCYQSIEGVLLTKDGKSLLNYPVGSKASTYTVPATVTSIEDYAFGLCLALTSVTIPTSVTSIGEEAFAGCSALKSFTILGSVTSIGRSAFYDCTALTSIFIPSSVSTMGSMVFGGCSALTISCGAAAQPSGWASDWNPNNRPVTWGASR
jgi:hypothetical protein